MKNARHNEVAAVDSIFQTTWLKLSWFKNIVYQLKDSWEDLSQIQTQTDNQSIKMCPNECSYWSLLRAFCSRSKWQDKWITVFWLTVINLNYCALQIKSKSFNNNSSAVHRATHTQKFTAVRTISNTSWHFGYLAFLIAPRYRLQQLLTKQQGKNIKLSIRALTHKPKPSSRQGLALTLTGPHKDIHINAFKHRARADKRLEQLSVQILLRDAEILCVSVIFLSLAQISKHHLLQYYCCVTDSGTSTHYWVCYLQLLSVCMLRCCDNHGENIHPPGASLLVYSYAIVLTNARIFALSPLYLMTLHRLFFIIRLMTFIISIV